MPDNKKQSLWKRYISAPGSGVFLALIAFIIIVSALSPVITGGAFFTLPNIINIFRQQTYIGIIACALTLVMITGNIDLSIGSQLTLMTVISARLSQSTGDLSILIMLPIGIACGIINGIFVGGLKLNAFIATLGTGSIFGALALMLVSGGVQRSSSPMYDALGTGTLFGVIPIQVIVLLIVVAVFAFLLQRTVFGQRLYAIGANPAAARFSGVKSRFNIALAYVFTGLCCAIAAVMLLARSGSANPQIGTGKEMEIILAVVLGGTSIFGGKGSVVGTAVGFLFIGFMASGFTFLAFNQYLQWIATGVILVFALSLDVVSERRSKL